MEWKIVEGIKDGWKGRKLGEEKEEKGREEKAERW